MTAEIAVQPQQRHPATLRSRWIGDLETRLRCGKHIVLTGNVADFAIVQETFTPFSEALDQTLARCGYTQRAYYNSVDGVSFAEPEMEKTWGDLTCEKADCADSSDSEYRFPGAPASESPDGWKRGPSRGQVFQEAVDALAAARTFLRESRDEPAAFVIDFADLLFTPGEVAPDLEREMMVSLLLAFEEAHQHRQGQAAGMRNALILVASRADRIPPAVFRDHPLVAEVGVERPDAAARERYILEEYYNFFGANGSPPASSLASDFVSLTDGLFVHDLDSLRLLSHQLRIALDNPRKLIDRYRWGEHIDHWVNLGPDELAGAPAFLKSRIFGQDAAIDTAFKILVRACGGVHVDGAGRPVRPKGVLFLVGPTGVGKTELAKALAELVFRDSNALIRFDMNCYQEPQAAERLTGASPGYVGYGEGGQLTNAIHARPFSVVLFDEIEKAHPAVWQVLMQVLDDGRLTDGSGRTVFFHQTLLVFTSNEGTAEVFHGGGVALPYDDLRGRYLAAVKRYFVHPNRLGRPELWGRIGERNVLVYDVLREAHIPQILDKFLRGVIASTWEQHAVELEFDQAARDFLLGTCRDQRVLELGGRGIRNVVEGDLLDVVNEALRVRHRGATRLTVTANGHGIDVSSSVGNGRARA